MYEAHERLPKRILVDHVGEWHGHSRDVTPNRERWSHDELIATHHEQHRAMRRERVVEG